MAGNTQITLDLTQFKDRQGARVAPGDYNVVVEDVEVGKSNSGNTMVTLWFRIVGGDEDGSVLVDRLTITDKALFRVVAFMQAIGLKTPRKRFRVDAALFRNKRLTVSVDDGEKYMGRIPSNITGYMRGKASAKKETDPWETPEESEVEDEETTEEEVEEAPKPKAKAKSKGKAKAAPEPEEDDEDEDEDLDLEDVDIR